MLRREIEQGIGTVVLTPHFYAHRESPETFVNRRRASVDLMQGALTETQDWPRLYFGAEVAYYDGMSRTEDVDRLCIGDTNAMLVEMPFCQWNQRMLGELSELRNQRRIQPILAHIERYIHFQPRGMVSQLCESGFWIQSNASFFCRWQTARQALKMLKNQEIHFIGSDCHDLNHRSPNLGGAVERIHKKLGTDSMDFLQRMEETLLGGMQ